MVVAAISFSASAQNPDKIQVTPPATDGETGAVGDEDADGLQSDVRNINLFDDSFELHADGVRGGKAIKQLKYEIFTDENVVVSGGLKPSVFKKIDLGSSGIYRIVVAAEFQDGTTTQDVFDITL